MPENLVLHGVRPAQRPLRMAWLALVALLAVGLGYGYATDFEGFATWLQAGLAGGLTVLLSWGLANRAGGRPWLVAAFCLVLVGAAWGTGWRPLMAGGAVATAVLTAALGVLGTQPAPRFQAAAREALIATLVAAIGALGVCVWARHVDLSPERYGYVVLGLSLLGALALVFRLGAGLHGMGRRGIAVLLVGVVFLAGAMAYTEALARYGSPGLIQSLDDFRLGVRDTLHGVPHPVAALLGYPALVWGVFMRARRRQGWWVCAFGAAATASAATQLVDATVPLLTTVLSAVYSLVVGLVIGYLVIRAEQSLMGSRGSRARRSEEAAALRPEPGRLLPLR